MRLSHWSGRLISRHKNSTLLSSLSKLDKRVCWFGNEPRTVPKGHGAPPSHLAGKRPKSTLRGGSDTFNKWMAAIVSQIPVTTHSGRVLQVERALQVIVTNRKQRADRYSIYGYMRSKGASVDRVWDLGWALHDAGVSWMSGPVAVSAVPEYFSHLLGWFGTLLVTEGPSHEIRRLWPFFQRAIADFFVAWPPTIELPSVKAGPFIFERSNTEVSGLTLSAKQRQLANKAWLTWRQSDEIAWQFPWYVRAALQMADSEERRVKPNRIEAGVLARHNLSIWLDDVDVGWKFVVETGNWDIVLRAGHELRLI